MKWGDQQQTAIKRVNDWLKSDEQVFRLFGYAGTGKTTLAKHLAEGVSGRVLFAAYTGKAAQVLSTKGCPARTLHQLAYVPKHKSKSRLNELQAKLAEHWESLGDISGELKDLNRETQRLKAMIRDEEDNMKRMMFQLNLESDIQHSSLLVVDECSMVDGQMGEDILSFGTKVLVLGDPAQLPPVGGGGFFTEQTADFMLTDIHRQANGWSEFHPSEFQDIN